MKEKTSKKKDILNKLGNVDSSTKKLIKEEKFLDIDDEPVKRKRRNNNEYVKLNIYDKDTIFERLIKGEVNRRKITQEFINYRIKKILKLDDETANNRGYNMVYTVNNKKITIATERLELWIKILGLKDLECSWKETLKFEFYDED